MNFSIKDYFSKCEQIFKGKLHILCSDLCYVQGASYYLLSLVYAQLHGEVPNKMGLRGGVGSSKLFKFQNRLLSYDN